MIKYFGTAVRVTIVSIVIFGLIYPLAMTGIAQALFPKQANGSMVTVEGKVVGSWIVGQLWTKPQYFAGRPSAAGKGYDPTSTGGTNYGATSKKLIDRTKATIASLEKQNPDAKGPPPIDLVTSSASGIDPDISPEAAYWEAPRVAKARKLSVAAVDALIAQHVQGRTFGFLGEPHVNVLELNLALDGLKAS
ncbi:MAG TPA: potassium-transporting ATPase subunit KdpC [Candidatus Baltobacteraceae bacterium]|nr:potassium-transporting ATPase subunit KdpC [Candidatus Baltobacteraceae bacterium]